MSTYNILCLVDVWSQFFKALFYNTWDTMSLKKSHYFIHFSNILSIFQYFYVCKSLLAWFETLIWSLMSNILDRFSVSTHFGMFSKSFVRNFQEFWCICSKISDWCAQVQRGKHLFQAFFMPNLILYASFIAWVWPALPLRRPKFMK